MSYNCLSRNNARVMDKVILVNPSPHYVIGRANPVICSQYECCGIITTVERSRISVEWDNGTRNGYMDNELALFKYRKTIQKDIQNIKQKDIQNIKQGKWGSKSIVAETENGRYISIW